LASLLGVAGPLLLASSPLPAPRLPLAIASRLLGSLTVALPVLLPTTAAAIPARLLALLLMPRSGRADVEALDRTALDLSVHEPLDRRHQRTVFVADERDRFAFGTRAAGAADAVHVVFGDVRQVV